MPEEVAIPDASPTVIVPVAATAAPTCKAPMKAGDCGEPVPPGYRYCARHTCQAETAAGKPCRNPAIDGQSHCGIHQG